MRRKLHTKKRLLSPFCYIFALKKTCTPQVVTRVQGRRGASPHSTLSVDTSLIVNILHFTYNVKHYLEKYA